MRKPRPMLSCLVTNENGKVEKLSPTSPLSSATARITNSSEVIRYCYFQPTYNPSKRSRAISYISSSDFNAALNTQRNLEIPHEILKSYWKSHLKYRNPSQILAWNQKIQREISRFRSLDASFFFFFFEVAIPSYSIYGHRRIVSNQSSSRASYRVLLTRQCSLRTVYSSELSFTVKDHAVDREGR